MHRLINKKILEMLNNLSFSEDFNLSISHYNISFNYGSLEMRNNDSFIPTNNNLNCGGSLQDIAKEYANIYHPYCAICVCVFGTVSNLLNIAVLTRKDMACAPINRILTALAVADILLMIEYIPFAYYYYIHLMGKRDFPYLGAVFMVFHNNFTQTLHTMSICLTLTLAIWRYLAIEYPERNHTMCSDSRCTLGISLSFIISLVLCTPTYIIFRINSIKVQENGIEDTLYYMTLIDIVQQDTFLFMLNFWAYGVVLKLIPCFILTMISCWLIRTLFRAKKRKQVLRSYDAYPLQGNGQCSSKKKPSKAERRADRTTKMLIAVLLLFLLTEFPQGIFTMCIGLKGKTMFIECYQEYGEVMDIMALINGSVNFILYCFMNRMFRATFGQLFKNKLLGKLKTPPPSEVHTTYV